MCPVQWRGPSRRPQGLQFTRWHGNCVITTLQHPSDYAYIDLHWQETANQSIPCMGPTDCILCPGGVKTHAYTVAMMWDHSGKRWYAVIADLGHPDSDLVRIDYRGKIVAVGREKSNNKRSNLTVREVTDPKPGLIMPALEPIDVRPHLMRRYGLFKEADYFEHKPYVEQQSLQFPSNPDQGGEVA